MTLTLWGVQIWAATLVFGRVGAMVMLLPGFGEPAIPARVRLGFALALALAIAPNVAAQLPEPPSTAWGISGLIMGETMIGVMLGGAARMLVSSLATAGQIFGLEIGLAFAQTADPTMTQSGQVMAVFMSLMGVALIFATGLDHMFLQGVAGTYDLIAPGATVPIGDSAQLALGAAATSFRVGFQIAAPVVVAGLIFRLGLGALSRLIPQIQVFFVVLPLQVMGGFVVMALALSTGMLMWLDSLEQYATWVQG
jgi:flagellar biosynthesis protein FliR